MAAGAGIGEGQFIIKGEEIESLSSVFHGWFVGVLVRHLFKPRCPEDAPR